ncbi:phosphoglycolate phosphatase [Methylotenera sp. G11]|uniref:phosphoglycolate phosphatase n=1 Tax=Methylotenera sp. G11 TaxID=1506585 RepID=UPI000648F8D6|nr:phosphoglycolate phosphatase [Methylotenera sp. G11]
MAFHVKAVMFDLDGTLVHTAPEIAASINKMLVELDFPALPHALIEHYIGEGAQTLVRRCITANTRSEPDAALLERAQALFFAHYADNVTLSRSYDGVIEALAVLQDKGLKLACVTNKPERFTLPLLDKSGLLDFFEIVVSGDTLVKKKPDPIQLRYICAKFNVLEAESMLVGDSLTDVAAAHAAGCYIVTVSYGYNQGKPIDHSLVDDTIASLADLAGLLT